MRWSLDDFLLFGCVLTGRLSHTDSCRDFDTAFERVFAVPGEAAVLHCTLDIHQFFNPANTSYNITWYDKRTGSEVTRLDHDVILRDEALWFINITWEHKGHYACVIRYGQRSLLLLDGHVSFVRTAGHHLGSGKVCLFIKAICV